MTELLVALVLFLAGGVLLFAEILTPGLGFCGVAGLVLIVVSLIFTLMKVPYGVFIVAGEIALAAILGAAFFRFAKRRQLYGKIVLSETLAQDEQVDLRFFIGREGVSKTPLKPAGVADFNGSDAEVYSEDGFLKAGVRVKVFDVKENKIFVREIK